jgi:hypothetical protein
VGYFVQKNKKKASLSKMQPNLGKIVCKNKTDAPNLEQVGASAYAIYPLWAAD